MASLLCRSPFNALHFVSFSFAHVFLSFSLSKEGPSQPNADNFDSDNMIQFKEIVQIVKDAQKALGSNSLLGLHGLLHLGLLISPVIFVSPCTLAKYSYNHYHVLTVMHHLGVLANTFIE